MSTQIIDLCKLIFQGADDVDYVNTHPEIVRVPDPEILMVFIKKLMIASSRTFLVPSSKHQLSVIHKIIKRTNFTHQSLVCCVISLSAHLNINKIITSNWHKTWREPFIR